ncbi:uncharacterized protein LOC115879277 [Sitophilus oryzae]|uniref:Uncharacterized protein LOC115879277 n=1 Tax=Sitophilus oryzae TaxID=7048 RepID=A0A6J2XMG9_SITOR|nr:uncharacterized protein LOC115879277 [Sitophilus oryzae]
MHLEILLVCVACVIAGIKASAIHGPCETDEDCGTIDTECNNNVCTCKPNFAVWFDSCVALPQPRITCHKKHDCHRSLGVKSMCTKKNQCACKPFHHLHQGQCVKNRDLHDTCDHDHQCYCGEDCQEKIACIHKNCSCKAGHKPYRSRRCISDTPFVLRIADQVQLAPIKATESFVKESTVASSTKTLFSSVISIVLPIFLLIK